MHPSERNAETFAPGSPDRNQQFRPEIEGLRAVAAGLVAVFHVWLGRVSGGVDVFFVVSGFLITTSLVGQAERSGQIRFALFWGRLIKRLVPAAMVVLCAVIVASMLLLPTSRWRDTIPEVAASATYVQNWLLAAKSIDYLAQFEAVSPLQHYWALSVQGQFYLLWPFLAALGVLVARRFKVGLRPLLLTTFGLIFAVSLAYSVFITARDQPFAYFNTFARMWEFSIGAMLAVALPWIHPGKALRVAMGWIGLLAILSCGLILTVSRVFPGYFALWPTLAAAFIIVAGNTQSPIGVDRLLASPPLVYLGKISYSVYLWHFPILIFSRNALEPQQVGPWTGLAIILAAVLLAAATERWLETPARQSSIGKQKPAHAFAFGAACLLPVALGLALWGVDYQKLRDAARKITFSIDDPSYPGAMALEPGFIYQGKPNVPVYPGPFAVSDDDHTLAGDRGCSEVGEPQNSKDCIIGPSGPKLTIAVVGGSHSAHWVPALERITGQVPWQIVSFARSGCPFRIDGQNETGSKSERCRAWNQHVLAEVLQLRPDVVFTTSTRFTTAGKEIIPEGYLEAWRRLESAGIRIVAVRDNPRMAFDVSACVELKGRAAPSCSRPRVEALASDSPVESLQRPPANVSFIDLSNAFCDKTTCYPVVGNVLVYRHGDHITSTYSLTMAPILYRELHRALDTEIPQAPAPDTSHSSP